MCGFFKKESLSTELFFLRNVVLGSLDWQYFNTYKLSAYRWAHSIHGFGISVGPKPVAEGPT